MKAILALLCIGLGLPLQLLSQATDKTNQVIEGGKLIVELVKAFGPRKDTPRDEGCKGHHADFCFINETAVSLTVTLEHRASQEKREIVILPSGKECFLQAGIGVWTYDLKYTGSIQSLRKGDTLIEGCNNLTMTIK